MITQLNKVGSHRNIPFHSPCGPAFYWKELAAGEMMELCLVLLANPYMHIIYTQIKPKLAKLSRVSYRGGEGRTGNLITMSNLQLQCEYKCRVVN